MDNSSFLVYGIYIAPEDSALIEEKHGEDIYGWWDGPHGFRGYTHLNTCTLYYGPGKVEDYKHSYVLYDNKAYYCYSVLDGGNTVVDPVHMKDRAILSTVDFDEICDSLGIPRREPKWLLVS